ncbi:Y-family DNA polymerase [Bacillus pumilus]|uniref:Y-family DNA polymerase n=1 Tax=Bacillus pumilus TaxID=1408 RepID=UPI0011A04BF3|nr:UV damage repair protein UvrX [Bacillus pumilus]
MNHRDKKFLAVDVKSFYASAAAIMMDLDPLTCYLAVVGNKDRSGSVVLAASPALKRDYHIKTGSRLYEIPSDPRIHIVNPQMRKFIDISTALTELFYSFAPPEDVYVYSIDESFIRWRSSRLWGSPKDMAVKIKESILRQFGLTVTIGIGENMLLSKLAMDLESKKSPSGIAEWTADDLKEKLWPVRPLSKMWGIGRRMERNLNGMGISTVGQLANYPKELLQKKFGVIGMQLHYHANGIDTSEINHQDLPENISFGKSQILLRDYPGETDRDIAAIKTVILEIAEAVASRARKAHKAGRTVSLSIGYSVKEGGGGFSRAKTIDQPTNVTMDIFRVCEALFDQFHSNETVRSIAISLSKVDPANYMQLDLFKPDQEKVSRLGHVMDEINNKFGHTAIMRAASYTNAGTMIHRSNLVGGHMG